MIMRIVCICLLFLISGYDCWGQVSLQWMQASSARRKRLEQILPPSAHTRYAVPPPHAQNTAGARLGLALDRASVRAIWAEEQEFLLPAPPKEQSAFKPQLVLSLSAFRLAKYWHLTQQTVALLLPESAYNYRLDLAKSPYGNVNVTLTPVLNKGPQGKTVKLRFFMKPVTKWVYGLFMQGCVSPQPNPPQCTQPVLVGRLSR